MNNLVNNYIYEIDLDYSNDKLIKESESIGYINGYLLMGRPRPAFKTLLEARIDNMSDVKKYSEIQKVYNQIIKLFKCKVHSITFYKVNPNTAVGPHKDPFIKKNIGFAINILLSNEDKKSPLRFIIDNKHYDVFYKCILFNASEVMHYVPNVEKERIVLRYFIKGISYEEGVKICQSGT